MSLRKRKRLCPVQAPCVPKGYTNDADHSRLYQLRDLIIEKHPIRKSLVSFPVFGLCLITKIQCFKHNFPEEDGVLDLALTKEEREQYRKEKENDERHPLMTFPWREPPLLMLSIYLDGEWVEPMEREDKYGYVHTFRLIENAFKFWSLDFDKRKVIQLNMPLIEFLDRSCFSCTVKTPELVELLYQQEWAQLIGPDLFSYAFLPYLTFLCEENVSEHKPNEEYLEYLMINA